MCRRMVCDCDNPNADLFCCPECDPRLSSQCMHQNGLLTYGSGDTWVENCQQCQCLVSARPSLTLERWGKKNTSCACAINTSVSMATPRLCRKGQGEVFLWKSVNLRESQ